MSEINCFDSHENHIDHLTQWDVNQVLYIKDWEYESLPIFHFCNIKSEKAIVVKGELADGKIMSKIPNILLQEPYAIIVFVYLEEGDADDNDINNDISASKISGKSVHVFRIPVRKKPKPEDYEYQENIAYMSWVKIEQEIRDRIEMIMATNEERFNKFEDGIKELATWTFSTTGFAKKNLLKNMATDKIFDGVGTTVRRDGGVEVSFTEDGIISGDKVFREFEVNSIELNPGQYTISGCPVNNGGRRLVAIDTTNGNLVAIDTGNGASFTVSEKRMYRICIHVSLIEKNNSLVFYPMLRGAAIKDSKYEKYVPSLQEQIKSHETILLKLQSNLNILNEYINVIIPYVVIDSGTCGEGTDYSLCADGTLHIAGVGNIDDRAFATREDFGILNVNIGGNVGAWAFAGCKELNEVKVNCTKICDEAFLSCPKLNSLTIGRSVTEIGSGILTGCAFYIPSGVRVMYSGTIAEWNAITKAENWVGNGVDVENNVVICSDGTVEV